MRTFEEYFSGLAARLNRLPPEERADVIAYYKEYAQEGGLLDAAQLIEHFGPPETLAAQILAESAVKRVENGKGGGWKTVAVTLAALFAAPFTFPIGLAAVVVLFVSLILLAVFLGTVGTLFWGVGTMVWEIGSGMAAVVFPADFLKLLGIVLLGGSALAAVIWGLVLGARFLFRKLLMVLSKVIERRNTHA